MNLKKLFIIPFLAIIVLTEFWPDHSVQQIPQEAKAQTSSFRFIAWADTEDDGGSGNNVLTNASNAVKNLNPAFTLYPGDMVKCSSSNSCWQSGAAELKDALNGRSNNGIFNKTFATRGNHEDSADSAWRALFDFRASATSIGATNYSEQSLDMTYSFDYGNSHFVGIDMTGGDVTSMSLAQINWLDQDLTDAENRGMVNAFLFWHGPFYPVGKHCCSNPPSKLVTVLNNHPIVAAGFFGHEMILTYTHIKNTRVTGISAGSEFEEFVVGNVGDGEQGSQKSGRTDYVVNTKYGFVSVDVSCNNFTVSLYKLNGSTATVDKTYNFTNGSSATCTPITPVPDTQPPTVVITCPPNGKTYGSPLTSISGTAADNVGVVKVEVKVGPSGAWQLATATDSWATWVVSNLAGVVAGANTIYARATDAAGNTSGDNAVFITVNYDPTAVINPALGNFQVKSLSAQDKPEILYDAYTDINTINSFGAQRKSTSSGEQATLESFGELANFNWSPDFISGRFDLARANASKTDYLVFLMQEEMVQPSWGWFYGIRPGFPGDSATHTVDSVTGATANWGASSSEFYLQLLTAWKQLCTSTGKKCALLVDGQENPAAFFPRALGDAGVNYVAANFDMIYVYSYPKSVSDASCGSGFPCGKTKVEYWKSKNFAGKINYILALEAPMNTAGYDIVKADFASAADAGANIISAYPNWTMDDFNDTQATARMIQIWNEYGGSSAAPACTVGPGPGPIPTPIIPATPTPFCSPDFGKPCASAENSCGQSAQGTIQCNGRCSAVTPSAPDCNDGKDCTFDSCDLTGTCEHTDVCGGLVPCGRLVDDPKTSGIDESAKCDLCSFAYMLKKIINFALEKIFIIAAFVIVISGFMYATSMGNVGKARTARQGISYAFTGIFLVFTAWFIIAVALNAIGYGKISDWNQVNCTLVKK